MDLGEGKKFCIYLREKQLEYLDRKAEEEGTTRSGYIQNHLLPDELKGLKEGYLYKRDRGTK